MPELKKLRKIAALYTELRNRNRGKEMYEEYNKLAQEHRAKADELEKQERQARELAERKKKLAKMKHNGLIRLKFFEKTTLRPQIERVEDIIGCYTKLTTLFANEDEKQLSLYQTNVELFKQKKSYLTLLDSYNKSSDKSQQMNLLRQAAQICDNPDRANEHMVNAQKLQDEIHAEDMRKAYEDSYFLLAHAEDKVSRAKIYRILSSYAQSESQSFEHRQQAEQLEAEAQIEQEKQQLIVNKTCRIVCLTAEINKIAQTNPDKIFTQFKKLDTLAGLLQQRSHLQKVFQHLSKNVPEI